MIRAGADHDLQKVANTPSDALVTPDQLEKSLQRLRTRVLDPRLGIHGPGTISWTIDRENVLFLGGGRAALLQIAHPFVAAALEDHSKTFDDAAGRFRRTFENVWAMTFGDLDQAFQAARRVHRVHASIHGKLSENVGLFRRGDSYNANQAGALLWVYATLVDTSILVFEQVVRDVSLEEKDRFLVESKGFARLFGIPEELLPANWGDFRAYMDGMLASGAIVAEGAAVRIAKVLLHPPSLWLAPVAKWYRVVTAWLLPEPLREPFGLGLRRTDACLARASIALLRNCHRFQPSVIRFVPAYRSAIRRLRQS